MKPSVLRAGSRIVLFIATASLALAHPGHDGDHGLTWDFTHLAAHPLATAAWLLVIAASGWCVAQLVRERSTARLVAIRSEKPAREV